MANHDEIWKEREDLNRALDSALARYRAVEPREGLEERILANVRAADTRSMQRTWWHWGFTAALAAGADGCRDQRRRRSSRHAGLV